MRTFIDLFCGIGGFRLALEARGLSCVFSSDNDEKVSEAYRCNFGDDPLSDIRTVLNENIPPHDILCAGFPCQPFSSTGNLKALDDTRGTLFYEIACKQSFINLPCCFWRMSAISFSYRKGM